MSMVRLPWTIANGVLAVCLLSASILLMVPNEFRRSTNNGVGVRIDWTNLICTVPKPNVNITDGQVYEFWQLPISVRLSTHMMESGRCGVAVDQYNSKRASKIDPSICYCADIWWVPFVSLVSLVMGLQALFQFILGLLFAKNGVLVISNDEMRKKVQEELIRKVLLGIAAVVFMLNSKNNYSFTNYEELFPTDYLDNLPIKWSVGLHLFLGSNVAMSIFFIVLTTCGPRCVKSDKQLTKSIPMPRTPSPEPPRPSPSPPETFFHSTSVQTRVVAIDRESAEGESTVAQMLGPPSSPVLFTVCEVVSVDGESDTTSSLSSIMLTANQENDQSTVADQDKSEVAVVEDKVTKVDRAADDPAARFAQAIVKAIADRQAKAKMNTGSEAEKEESKSGADGKEKTDEKKESSEIVKGKDSESEKKE